MSVLVRWYFRNEDAAHDKLEAILWPDGPVCPHCGASDRIGRVTGKGARVALRSCGSCGRQFRATIGTLFESSHVPLHKWFQAVLLLGVAQRRISAYRLALTLDVSAKTGRAMMRRLVPPLETRNAAAAGRPAPVASPPSAAPSQEDAQVVRFVEQARRLGCDEREASFDACLLCILGPRH